MSLNSIYIWRCQTKATIEDTASLTNKKGRRGGTIALTATRIESPIIKLLDRTLKKLECRPCGLSFYQLKDASPFPVKHSDFPKTPEGYPAEHPCADGGTIWIPLIGNPDVMISQFLHELAHCLLHYPNGRDPDMEDPVLAQVRETGNHDLLFESPMEAEACAAAYLAARMLSLPDSHNETYLSIWRGDMDKFRRESLSRCISAAKAIAANYQVPINGQSITERTTPITEPMTYKFNPHGDHVLVNMDGKWLMIDTGADTTVGNTATFKFGGRTFPCVSNYFSFTAEGLTKSIGHKVDYLVGLQVLQHFPFIINWDRKEITFYPQGHEFKEGTIVTVRRGFMGLLLYFPFRFNREPVEAVFDTGAPISYMPDIKGTPDGTADDFYPGFGTWTTKL